MHDHEPDFWRNLRRELAGGRHWVDRAVVLAYAAATGLVVVGFTLLADAASEAFEQLRHLGEFGAWLPLVWTPALTVALLWWTRRFVPGALGSGIPQVVRALDDDTAAPRRAAPVWSRCVCRCTRSGSSRAGCWPVCRSAARGRPCRSAPA